MVFTSIVLSGVVAGGDGIPAVPVTLNALTASPATAAVGTPFSSTIGGLTSGSSVELSGAGSAGLSIAGAVITGTPTSSGAINIIESRFNATNSPRTTTGVINVTAAGGSNRFDSTGWSFDSTSFPSFDMAA